MKRILLVLAIICSLSSCVTTSTIDTSYEPYDVENNVVINDNVCYVYYTNPSTLFLNSLHIVDGAYYYWYTDRYIPVVFPRWEVWSPHRYFYYDRNRWVWRDRFHYDHNRYRREHHWVDYRKQPHRMIPNTVGYSPSIFNNGRPQQRFGKQIDRPMNKGGRSRITQPNISFGNGSRSSFQPQERGNGSGHFGGRR